MKLEPKVKKFQEGGAAPAPAAEPIQLNKVQHQNKVEEKATH